MRKKDGLVLLHSRRSFGNIEDKFEVELNCWLWAVESMRSHNISRVIFALQATELVSAVSRPKDWPSFSFHFSEVREALKGIVDWKVVKEISFF